MSWFRWKSLPTEEIKIENRAFRGTARWESDSGPRRYSGAFEIWPKTLLPGFPPLPNGARDNDSSEEDDAGEEVFLGKPRCRGASCSCSPPHSFLRRKELKSGYQDKQYSGQGASSKGPSEDRRTEVKILVLSLAPVL